MVKRSLVLSLLSFIFFFYSCGEKNSNNPQDESLNKSDPENFSDKMKDASENFTEGKKVNPVDFRDLKALLPESIGDLKRSNLEGEKVAAMGMNISHANADYSDADHTVSIDLKITDLGSVSGLSALAAYGWYMFDIDKENDTGYEKTITYKGNKGYEKYDNEGKYGELSVLVAKRFVIEANGNNILMDQLKAAVDMIDLAKLESWKDFGIEE
ncbi:MAG TPA: hypothetical protein DHV28_08345 [Ignavibacteriales bacterium]|nr:hypothetical protein [Ignavibacteriales bacterium]